MALMEFLKQNLVNTTTQMTVTTAQTGTIQYVFDRNINLGFTSVGFDSSSTLVLGFTFATPQTMSHILLQNHNLKDFRIYYNSVTANSLLVATTNSETSTYLAFSTVTGINSLDIQMNVAQAASTEKRIGEVILTERRLVFERNPSVTDWKPNIRRKQIVHDMPDGGVKVYNIRDKFQAKLGWKFITSAFETSLLTVFGESLPLYFPPFPTTTGWDGAAYEVVWVGDFEFKHGDNSKSQGFEGGIDIRQTAGG